MIACCVKEIRLSHFQILSYRGQPELTTAISDYSHSISPFDGGINIFGQFAVGNVSLGKIYITQVCNNHDLLIRRDNRDDIRFSTNADRFKDVTNSLLDHFKIILVRQNKIVDHFDNGLIFMDAPFRGLLPDWNRVEYSIAFETWFQYSESPDNQIIPLLSFKWDLRAVTERESDGWKIIDAFSTPPEEIMAGITIYGPGDAALSIGNLPPLGEVVRNMLKQSQENQK